ncbi:MAG TPA: hypothetical protein VKT78_12540 [Fimbriimonadaceae bacterium]|nr:hypothetical protein [Fimbriimonadaceae bacterium]
MLFCKLRLARAAAVGIAAVISSLAAAQIVPLTYWAGYGGNAQHSGQSVFPGPLTFPALPPAGFPWPWFSFPIDTNPTYTAGVLDIHYGELGMTATGNLVAAVRHGVGNPYTIEGHNGGNGNLIWSVTSGYILPVAATPVEVGPVLLPTGARTNAIFKGGQLGKEPNGVSRPSVVTQFPLSTEVAWPESGGRIAIRANADHVGASVNVHAFYGDANYLLNSATFNNTVKVCTPLTAGTDGAIYFGYTVEGPNPLNLKGGLAVIRPNGQGAFISAAAMANDPAMTQPQYNGAPAISQDGTRVYMVVSSGYSGHGYLCAVNTRTFHTMFHVALMDPFEGTTATVTSDSTSSPAIAPDGSIFVGVMEHTYGSNNGRGYMLWFSYDLSVENAPGLYGWDCTPSFIPFAFIYPPIQPFIPYWQYQVVMPYNNPAGVGSGTGLNYYAAYDPALVAQNDANSAMVFVPVEGVLGSTPDPVARGMGFSSAVYPFSTGNAAIDMTNADVFATNADGLNYDFRINALSVTMLILNNQPNPPVLNNIAQRELSTSTIIGENSWVYMMHNGRVWASNGLPPP